MNDIEGLRILVTGGSSGIGAATARQLAACGARIVIGYRDNRTAAEELAASLGGDAAAIAADVTDAKEVAQLVEQSARVLGGLDGVVHAAGAIERTRLDDSYDDAVFERVMALNVQSVPRLCAAAYPYLKASGRGFVILTGSVAGRNGGAAASGVYAAAKAAVHSLTRSLAKEYAGDGIRVNAVAPGVIRTPFHDATPPELLKSLEASIPMGRLGTAEACAGAYLFLASNALSGYITGQIIDVNGGQMMP